MFFVIIVYNNKSDINFKIYFGGNGVINYSVFLLWNIIEWRIS